MCGAGHPAVDAGEVLGGRGRWPRLEGEGGRAGTRPAWQLRLGLFVYDHLGGREVLPDTDIVDLAVGPVGVPLKRRYRRGFEYSDCCVDDARLVVANAVDAAERGAVIRTRTRCTRAERDGRIWRLVLNLVNASPRTSIYIDDREVFVNIAAELGFTAIQHTSLETTRRRLLNLGVSL